MVLIFISPPNIKYTTGKPTEIIMNRIFFASLLLFFAFSLANCASISQAKNRNIENKSAVGESEDESRISHRDDKEISQSGL